MKKSTNSDFMPTIKHLCQLLVIGTLFSQIITSKAIAEEFLKTLTVTGNGVEKIEATQSEVELGVEIQDKTAGKVQQEIAEKTSAIVKLLRSKNVEQLQTTGVRLEPNYDQFNQKNTQRVLIGYIGANTISFVISTEEVGRLLDNAIAAGASRIDGIRFTATPEAVSIAKEEALRKASINAQDKAEIVLKTLNLTSQEIVNIKIDQASITQPQPFASGQYETLESRANTPIISGNQAVKASVTLQISY